MISCRQETKSSGFTIVDSNVSLESQQPFTLDNRVQNEYWTHWIDNSTDS